MRVRTLGTAMRTLGLPLRSSLLFIALPLAVLQAAETPPTYSINLAPAQKVGTRYNLISDLTNESQTQVAMTMPGASAPQKQEQTHQLVAHFEGETEVLAIFPNGSVQKANLTVGTFIATSEGQPLPGLPAAGQKIVAEVNDGQKSYTVDGKPAEANLAKLLSEIIDLGDEKYTDQDRFGPAGAVPVGATWPVNSTALMTELKKDNDVDMSSAKGTVKLDAIQGKGADQQAVFTGVFVVQGAKPTLPPGMVVDSMTMSGGLSGTVPTSTQGILKKTMTRSMQMAAHGSGNGIDIKVDSTGKEMVVAEVKFH